VRRFLTFLAVAATVAAGLATVLAQPAVACSCAPPPGAPSLVEQADAVFVGTVVARRDLPQQSPFLAGDADWTFDVESVVKGPVGAAREVVRTHLSSPSCGIVFDLGARYIVYARRVDERLTTGLCSGTALAAQAAPPVPPAPPAVPTPGRVRLTG